MTDTRETARSIAILGSCVARDTIEHLDLTAAPVAYYSARHSLISTGHNLSRLIPEDHGMTSAFQERVVREDAAGTSLDSLLSASNDGTVVLWDLMDERGGVWEIGRGEYLTRSFDIERHPALKGAVTQAIEHEGGGYIPFGESQHFSLWKRAAKLAVGRLRDAGLLERTVLLAVPWASEDTSGAATPASFGLTAERANSLYERYYAYLERLGVTVVRPTPAHVTANAGHQWGAAPFHYVPEVYVGLIEDIENALGLTLPRKATA